MALKDLMKNIGGVFARVSADITRRPDGGTSHYRPLRKKNAEPQMGEMTQGQAPAQDPQYVHTGFTGMNPPTYYGGYDQQTGYDQTAYGQTGYSNTSFAPAYGQQQGGQTNYFRQDPAPRQDYVGKGSFTGQNGFPMAKKSNISYMPGVEPGAGRGQVHVEHIITLTGLKS